MTELPIRPRSITIASWILIVWGGSVLTLMLAITIFEGMKLKTDAGTAAACAAVFVAIGIGMLHGSSWARTLWLLGGPFVIAFTFTQEPDSGVIALPIYVVYAVILVRGRARLYFARPPA